MTTLKHGTPVRQVVKPPIEGVIVGKQYNENVDSFQYLVAYPDDDGDGNPQTKWFREHELEVLGDPAEVPEALALAAESPPVAEPIKV